MILSDFHSIFRLAYVLPALSLLFPLRQFFPHTSDQFAQKLPVINIFCQKHFLSSIVWELHRCIRHSLHRCRDRLYEEPVIVDPAKSLSAILQNILAHHCPEADIIQFRQLFQDKVQIPFCGCHIVSPTRWPISGTSYHSSAHS